MIGKCCDGKHVNLGSRVHLKVDGYVVVPNVYGRVGLFFDSVYTACETPNDSALACHVFVRVIDRMHSPRKVLRSSIFMSFIIHFVNNFHTFICYRGPMINCWISICTLLVL